MHLFLQEKGLKDSNIHILDREDSWFQHWRSLSNERQKVFNIPKLVPWPSKNSSSSTKLRYSIILSCSQNKYHVNFTNLKLWPSVWSFAPLPEWRRVVQQRVQSFPALQATPLLLPSSSTPSHVCHFLTTSAPSRQASLDSESPTSSIEQTHPGVQGSKSSPLWWRQKQVSNWMRTCLRWMI